MILIAGIGNIFLGDDAFGCEVARCLSSRQLPGNVRVTDFGIRGLDLAYELLKPYDAVILVDAASCGGAAGSLYVIDPLANPSSPAVVSAGFHEMNPMLTLELARRLGAELHNVRIVGCEPESFGEPEEGLIALSACVQAAVTRAVEVIESLIQEVVV